MSNIHCVKTRGVESKILYLGETGGFKRVITTNLEVVFTEGSNTDSIATWSNAITAYRENGDVVPSLSFGGITFTYCRILKADFPTGSETSKSAIKRGVYNLTIEESSLILNAVSIGDGMSAGGMRSQGGSWVEDITENISYSIGVNGQFNLNHTVTVVPNNFAGDIDLLSDASTLAQAVLNASIGPSSLNGSSFHSLYVGHGRLSSTVNQITGEVSYTRNLETLSNDYASGAVSNVGDTRDFSHVLILNKEGIITVTETGKMRALTPRSMLPYDITGNGTSGYTDVIQDIIPDAAARAASYFNTFVGNLDNSLGAPGFTTPSPLITSFPMEITKNINQMTQEASYSISFTNDPKIDEDGRTIERTSNVTQGDNGTVVINEKTSMLQGGLKDHLGGNTGFEAYENGMTWYINDTLGLQARIDAIWSYWDGADDGGVNYATSLQDPEGGGSNPNVFVFNPVNRTVSYNPNGKNLSYSVTYSSDKNLLTLQSDGGQVGIKRLDVRTNDKFPQKMVKEFPIPGVKMLVHHPGQTNLGSRTVSFSAVLNRDIAFFPNVGINSMALTQKIKDARDYLAGLAKTKLLNVFVEYPILIPDDMFLTDCTWTMDSRRNLTLTATAQYVAKL